MRILTAIALLACCSARAQLLVDEDATRARLVNGKTAVSLALDNRSDRAVAVRIDLEWVNPKGSIRSFWLLHQIVPPGKSTAGAGLPVREKDDWLFYRLRYSVTPDTANLTAFEPVRGILGFPNIAEHAFILRAVGVGGQPRLGASYEFRVFASHPVTHRPIAGVSVNIDKTAALTDASGAAVLRIAPGKDDDWSEGGTVTIEGTLGDLKAETQARRPAATVNTVRIDTDKPLYQPGQTAHIRILAIGGEGRARAGAQYAIRVLDSGDTLVQSSDVTTSRFGIASADWEIPSNAEPEKYQIEAKTEDEDQGPRRIVEVRRYELPSFRVLAAPVQPFYLLGQTPEVEVRGEYLFGKPVPGGTVKITEVDGDEALSQGVLDGSGHFRASLKPDLDKDDLTYYRFADRHFVAYVTDPTTNRTEERRFDVRISRDPLHLYIVKREISALGVRLYAAAYTPDGQPASADIDLLDEDRVLASGHTNRFGVVRLEIPPPDDDADDDLVVRARTAAGTATEDVKVSTSPVTFAVRLETDRTLYRAGEPIRCRIRAARDGVTGTLLAWGEDGRILYSRAVELHNRQAEAVIPYTPDLPRNLVVAFLSPLGFGYDSGVRVLYPGAADLRIAARPAQGVYQPGQRAAVSFQASTGNGAPVEAALGIAVVDQSVLERAGTDRSERRGWFSSEDSGARVGGLGLQDLLDLPPEKIDASYQLVAEAMLAANVSVRPDGTFLEEQASAFARAAEDPLDDVKKRLDEEYHRTLGYPTDNESLRAVAAGVFDSARDPWGEPYRSRFSIDGDSAVLELLSAGPDKKFGTGDDMVAMTIKREWFLPYKAAIRDVLAKLKDYPATADEFSGILDQAGIRFDRLRDAWGNPLRAEISHDRDRRIVEIWSPWPGHEAEPGGRAKVASYYGTYFRASRERIDAALKTAREFPADEAQFRALLDGAGIDLDGLRDPWGHPYTVVFRTDAHFGDRTRLYVYQEYQGTPVQRKDVIPTKYTYRVIEMRSDGADGKPFTYDDFTMAQFARLVEDNPPAVSAPPGRKPAELLGGRGTITGVASDATGEPIPDVTVTLNGAYETRTGEDGRYSFAGLPAGKYDLLFSHLGFQDWMMGAVPVRLGEVTRVDARLQVGTVLQTVTVSAEPAMLETSSASVSSSQVVSTTGPNFTPHVRDYFPETLLWNPELVTDAAGKASLGFKLADTITTWHVAVIGSTVDGRIAEGSAEIRAFQPFFVDLDPPQVLTVSDEISLPVPIRNYTDKEQTVAVAVAAPPALAILQTPRLAARIAASGSQNTVIGLRAASATDAARLRVTARGSGAADAIEKPVAIHPYGEPVSHSVNDLVSENRPLRLEVPAGAVPGSLRAEVKLYPNLLASVLESIEALLQKPTGCAEQTISASYVNLMVLRALDDADLHDERIEPRARRNLLSGYQRLLGFRASGGGFSYWPNKDPDIAITAYAIEFLEDADGFIEIDDDLADHARAWLRRQDPKDAAVRGLALRAMASGGQQFEAVVVDRLGELARTAEGMDDPYAIATFALAAMEAKKPELAAGAIERLRKLVHDEQGMAWWHLARNTPFYGWGRAGQLEATALVVTAMARWRKHAGADAQLDGLIGRGALFLLRGKDETGCWWSTQATVRVFAALFEALAEPGAARRESVEVLVNGASAARLELPGGSSVQGPVTLDVAKFLKPGVANEVSLRTPAGRLGAQARFTAWWYEPWKGPRTSDQLAFEVRYSTAETVPNQAVRCDVTVSRPSFRGYGMVIAEIGLPPGAEVDRGTLDDAKVDSYEVAPDHVTVYVWPLANDTRFSLTFRPRYAIRAVTAPSVLYDYYNPDARVVLPPVALVVK
jgi:hypothetical protein